MRDLRKLVIALAFSLGACVYPADDPTGIEVSWRFFESNTIDGDEGRRVRTCAGAQIDAVDVRIEDLDDPNRRGSFPFDCEEGYQTHAEFQTSASDVFVPLHPNDYAVGLTVRGPGRTETLAEREVDVLGRGLTVELFELVPPPVDWELSLSGVDACETVELSLFYSDPTAMLAHPPRNDEGQALPALYRESLQTDRELALFGEAAACSDEIAGLHVVPDIDRGAYRLEVTVDGRTCPIQLTLTDDTRTAIDLDNLPCDG